MVSSRRTSHRPPGRYSGKRNVLWSRRASLWCMSYARSHSVAAFNSQAQHPWIDVMPTLPDHTSSSPNSALELKIDVRSEGPVRVIALKGCIGSALADADRNRIQAEIQPGAQLALDFTDVREISGVGLRRLLLLTRHVRSLGGMLAIRGASEHVRSIADASGFHDLFRRAVPLPIPDVKPRSPGRIDLYPTHSYRDFALRPVSREPLGATALSQGVNFAVFSRHGTKCTLVLFEPGVRALRGNTFSS